VLYSTCCSSQLLTEACITHKKLRDSATGMYKSLDSIQDGPWFMNNSTAHPVLGSCQHTLECVAEAYTRCFSSSRLRLRFVSLRGS